MHPQTSVSGSRLASVGGFDILVPCEIGPFIVRERYASAVAILVRSTLLGG